MRFAILSFLVLLTCCSGTNSQSKQTLRINIQDEPQALDPRKARDLNSITLMHMLFEGLTRIGKDGKLELALAEQVEVSEDGLRYSFDLKKAFWTNGDPITSYDFAKSWRKVLDPAFPSDLAYQLFPIKGAKQAKAGDLPLDCISIQTPDPQILVVELECPTPYFLELLSFPSFFPVNHKIDESDLNWAEANGNYISNGPFALKEWKHSDRLQVVRNPSYWDSKSVKLRQIDLFMVNADTEYRMFRDQQLDWAGSPISTLPPASISTLFQSNDLKVRPLSGTYFLRVNTLDASPLSHPLFRRALSLSIDRLKITEHVLQGGHLPARSLVPPVMGLDQQPKSLDYDPEEATRLISSYLTQTGEVMSDLKPISLLYVAGDYSHLIVQALQQQIESALGIHLKLEAVERKMFYQRISKKEYQLAAGSWIADFNDPINFLEVFKYKTASTNNTGWEHPKYIEWLNQSAVCKDLEERKSLLRDAEGLLMEQMPIIPIFHFALNYLQHKEVKDVCLSPIGQIDFRWAYIEDAQSR